MERLVYQPKHKEKPRTKLRVRLVRWLFLGGIALSLLLYVPHIPQLQIKIIEVEGVDVETAFAIRQFTAHALAGAMGAVVPRRMFFAVRSGRLRDSIRREFPKLKEVRAKKRFPDSLVIRASERELFAILCNDKARDTPLTPIVHWCAYLDADGIAYTAAPLFAGYLILKIHTDFKDAHIGQEAIAPSLIEKFRLIKSALASKMGIIVESFELSAAIPSEFRVATADGFWIFFRVENNYENAFRVLGRILEDEIGDRRARVDYIDLRFGNKVFYKMK